MVAAPIKQASVNNGAIALSARSDAGGIWDVEALIVPPSGVPAPSVESLNHGCL
jgi:hypothetical protein